MSAAHKVLTQRDLFTRTLTFLRGLPGWLRDAIYASRGLYHVIHRTDVHVWAHDAVLNRRDFAGLERFVALQQHNDWYTHPPLVCLGSILLNAVMLGYCEVITWILDDMTKKYPVGVDPTRMLHSAVEAGQLQSAELVVARFPALLSGPRVPLVVMRSTVYKGAIPMLQWLIRHSLHCLNTSLVRDAVESGHLEVLRLLLDSGYEPCSLDQVLRSQRGCQPSRAFMEMTQLLLERGADRALDEDRLVAIIQRQQDVDLLQFLHVNGLLSRIGRKTLRCSMRYHCIDQIRYLLEHGLVEPTAAELYYCIGVSSNSTTVLRLLLKHSSRGCLVKARARAIRRGYGAVEAELTRWIDPTITDCDSRNHGSRAKRRRCQREPPPPIDE